MATKIQLRLDLSKIKTTIEVRYNTFEKASYDQYLMGCLVKETKKQPEKAEEYIDNITGEGSLNRHFNNLYNEMLEMDDSTINNIVNNSLYPTIKIDKSAFYTYYPDLNVSFYKGKKIDGDFQHDVIENPKLVTDAENIIKISPLMDAPTNSNELYEVELLKDSAIIIINNVKIEVPKVFLSEHIVAAPVNYEEIESKIKFNEISENEKWVVLEQSLIKSIIDDKLGFFNKDKEYCFIKDNFVRIVRFGEYDQIKLYSDKVVYYNNNEELSNEVAKYIIKAKEIRRISDTLAFNLLRAGIDSIMQQAIINVRYGINNNSKYIEEAIKLIEYDSIIAGWENDIVLRMINKQDDRLLSIIYNNYLYIKYEYEHLIRIPQDELRMADKEELERIQKDRQAKIDTINKILGEVAGSSLRTDVKNLTADKDS